MRALLLFLTLMPLIAHCSNINEDQTKFDNAPSPFKAISEKDILSQSPIHKKPRCFWGRYIGSFIQSDKHLNRIGIEKYNSLIDFWDRIEMGRADPQSPVLTGFNVQARQKAVGEFLSTDFGNKNFRGYGFSSTQKSKRYAFGRLACASRIICHLPDCPEDFKHDAINQLETAKHMLLDSSLADRFMAFLESYGQKLCLAAGLVVTSIAAYFSVKWIVHERNTPTQQLQREISNLRKDLKGNIDRLEGHAKSEATAFREFVQKEISKNLNLLINNIIEVGIIGACKGKNPEPAPAGQAFDDRIIELLRQELGYERLCQLIDHVGGLENLWFGRQGRRPAGAAQPRGPEGRRARAKQFAWDCTLGWSANLIGDFINQAARRATGRQGGQPEAPPGAEE